MPAATWADEIGSVSAESVCSADDNAFCCADQSSGSRSGCCKVSGDCDVDIPKRRFYITGIIGASFGTLQSGGTNTEGSFENTGGASDNLLAVGGAIGEAFERPNGLLRLELEGRGRSLLTGQTNSFEPPTPTYFYETRFADSWSLMANAWRDWNLTNRLGVYAGGGIGVSGYRLTVDDSVSSGYGQMTTFAGQVGTGMTFKLTDRITLDVGYRFFGTDASSLPITVNGSGGITAGTYRSNFYASELLLSVRIYEPFFSSRSVR
jgi:opacity protein-like surface antigen